MRITIVITICAALVGVAAAQAITIETDPTGLDIYSYEGGFLGTAPVTLPGPLEENLTIIVKSKAGDFVNVIEPVEGQEDRMVVIAVADKDKGFKKGAFALGILTGIGIVATSLILLFMISWSSY